MKRAFELLYAKAKVLHVAHNAKMEKHFCCYFCTQIGNFLQLCAFFLKSKSRPILAKAEFVNSL